MAMILNNVNSLHQLKISKGVREAMRKKSNSLSVSEIEARLGLKHAKPVALTQSDINDMTEKENYFEDWYEEELRNLYEG